MTCYCGDDEDDEDDHGHDPDFPGSTACNVDGCECIAFEAEEEE